MELKHAMDQFTSGSEDFGVGQENGFLIRDDLLHQDFARSLETEFQDIRYEEKELLRFNIIKKEEDRIVDGILNFDCAVLDIKNHEGILLTSSPKFTYVKGKTTFYFYHPPLPHLNKNQGPEFKIDICNCNCYEVSDRFGCLRQNPNGECQTLQISLKPEQRNTDLYESCLSADRSKLGLPKISRLSRPETDLDDSSIF
eukprot:GHVP01040413.1.p1 GENE.GHVP01040413.1~~GHVP01040413.1.p1  ORF type:complete len:199 (-),score=33.66 GHVP01040413.1:756-1352(-)